MLGEEPVWTIALLVGPILLGIAWRGWLKTSRSSLPAWRNGAALTALLLASLDWTGAVLVQLSALLPYGTPGVAGFSWLALHLWHPLLICALALSFALRGMPRAFTVLTVLLLLIGRPFDYYTWGG